jgi:hypothetical protein
VAVILLPPPESYVTVNESPKLADAELAPMASEVKTKHNAMTRRFITWVQRIFLLALQNTKK